MNGDKIETQTCYIHRSDHQQKEWPKYVGEAGTIL